MIPCKWVIRGGGANNSFWVFTTCKNGKKTYLPDIYKKDQLRPTYDGKKCPFCGKAIEIDLSMIDDMQVYEVEYVRLGKNG